MRAGLTKTGTRTDSRSSHPRTRSVSGRVFFSSRRRHTRFDCDWSSDVCSSDLHAVLRPGAAVIAAIAISLAFAWGYLIQGDYGIFDVLETALIAAFLVALAEDFVGDRKSVV